MFSFKVIIRKLLPEEKDVFNQVVNHPLQSWQWGEFKEKTGMEVVRLGAFEKGNLIDGFQILLRKIPGFPFSAGQLLKNSLLNSQLISALKELAKEEKIIFIKLEPDFVIRRWANIKGQVQKPPVFEEEKDFTKLGLVLAPKPLFDPYSFILNLNQTEEALLSNMHSKTRYNIGLAEKSGVTVEEKSDSEGLEIFISLLFQETLKRQKFYLHSPDYFRKMWQVLSSAKIAHLLVAKYKKEFLSAWMIFIWKGRLFYPYGASTSKYRNLMASNLICWRAILFGKEKGCREFDMWGGLGPDADENHPWFGFHRFKLGYGPELVEYAGSWDLIVSYWPYRGLQIADSLRWKLLRLRKILPF